MSRLVEQFALAGALFAALLAALAGAWREVPVPPLLLRAATAGLTVYVFTRAAGGLLGRSLLRGLAEDELKRQEAPSSDSAARAEAAERRKAA